MREFAGGYQFDETRKRDPADRAAVDKLRRYAVEQGGTVKEVIWRGDSFYGDNASFVFGWEGDFLTFFACYGEYARNPQVEVVPPEALKELHHLQTVWIHGYNVIPDSIRALAELRHISIASIKSSLELPTWIGDFPQLEELYLTGYFFSIPYSVVQTGLPFTENRKAKRGVILNVALNEGDVDLYLSNNRELIEAYYSGEQAGDKYAIRECKVIFLGDGGVGKSSLIERIMEDSFQLGKHATEGMRVIQWTTELDGKPFRLRFLDFGGQEIMHSMHRCFLSGHTVYVVVCAARDDTEIDAVAARWLEQVKSYAPGCPVILALNKADENPGISVNETNLRERFQGQGRDGLQTVLKTSAAKGPESPFHVGYLYDAIMDLVPFCIRDLRGNRGMLAVKQALEDLGKQKKPYIKAEEYRKLCEDNNVKGEKLQRSMLEWFRDLGVAYFYERENLDLRLESLRVLDPVWLTNGIYRLILRAGKRVKNGVLNHDDIRKILAEPHKGDAREDVSYSAEETEFVLHVMRKFEISHEMDGGRELVPMLMEKDAQKAGFSAKDAVHLRWEGLFLPNNVIHKLMIRKYEELDQRHMWRTGAQFRPADVAADGCRALAEMTDDKSLDVYVSGGDEDAQRVYLDGFREEAGKILFSLNLRETKEYVCCTINGKRGQILRSDLLFAWKNQMDRYPVPGIEEFVNPKELLLRTYLNPGNGDEPSQPSPETGKERAEKRQIYLDMVLKVLKTLGILIGAGILLYALWKGVITVKDLISLHFGGD